MVAKCRYAAAAKTDAPMNPQRHSLYRHSSFFTSGELANAAEALRWIGFRGQGTMYRRDDDQLF